MNTLNTISWLKNSVRCFFPLAALSAVMGPAYLVCVIVSHYPFAHPIFTIFDWHAFEMFWGFFHTLIAGFILTAGGHWSGNGPLSGKPLAFLLLIWLIDKASLYFQLPSMGYLFFAVLFPAALIFYAAKVLKGYPKKAPFLMLLGVFGLTKLSFLAGTLTDNETLEYLGIKGALWTLIILISIVGGRILPNFTRNHLKLKNELTPPKSIEYFALIGALSTALWIIPHDFKILNMVVLTIAALGAFARLLYYNPLKALGSPMLGVLHVGYFLFAFGLLYAGLAELFPNVDRGRASWHLLATGGISLIAINIMVRASLGHTGREVKLNPSIAIMFACILIGSLLRVFIPPLFPRMYYPSLHSSMGFWTLAFVIYIIKFTPMLIRPRADGKD